MFVLGVILLLVAAVVSLVGSIMLAVAAFKESMLWGFLVLFVPFAAFVYVALHWQEAKRGFLVSVASIVIGVIGFGMFFTGAASMAAAKAQEQAALISKQAPAGRGIDSVPAQGSLPVSRAVSGSREPARPEPSPLTALPQERTFEAAAAPAPEPSEPPARAMKVPELPSVETGVIAPAALSRHLGETIVISQRDGRRVTGKLLGTNARGLRVQRYLGAGTLTYEISRDDVVEVRTTD